MEAGKRAEAGPSAGGDEKQREMRENPPSEVCDQQQEEEEEDHDDHKEEGAVVTGFVPGPLLSLKDQIEKDKEDDSLRRWKEKLLGCVEGDLNGQLEPEVKFHSIGIMSDDFEEINTPLPIRVVVSCFLSKRDLDISLS